MARTFDGTDPYLRIASGRSSWQGVDQITIGAWVYMTDNLNDRRIVHNWDSNTVWLLATNGTSGGFLVAFQNLAGFAVLSADTTSLTPNAWHWVSGAYERNAAAEAWVDGSIVDSTTPPDFALVSSGTECEVGGSSTNGTGYSVEGSVGEVAIWNRRLTSAEQGQLAAGFSPELVARDALTDYWPLVRGNHSRVGGLTYTDNNSPGIGSHAPVLYARSPTIYLPGTATGGGVTDALTGSSVTTGAGTVSPHITYALTGSEVGVSSGTITSALSYGITGSEASVSAGALTEATVYGLTGSEVATETGTIAETITYVLDGEVVAVEAGTVSIPGDETQALTGSEVGISTGTIRAVVTYSVSGSEVTNSAGTLSETVSYSCTGSAVSVATGTVSPLITYATTGSAVTVSTGSVSPLIRYALTGETVDVEDGSVVSDIDAPVRLGAIRVRAEIAFAAARMRAPYEFGKVRVR